ncbi:MAG: DUF3291 domain-containing protein [Acidimicrobiales bacterium]
MTDYQLAQINIGKLHHPLEAPETAEFTNALDPINELAESSPGFIWRLKDEDGGSSSYVSVPGHEDPMDIVNFSIWQDLDSLKNFMYKTDHVGFLRRRTEWFVPPEQVVTALWWIPAGTVPSILEAYDRLDHLRQNGASDHAWPLTQPFPPPGS